MQISVLAITIGNRNLVLIAAVLSVLKRDKKTDPGLLRSMPRDQRSSQEQLWSCLPTTFSRSETSIALGLFGKAAEKMQADSAGSPCSPERCAKSADARAIPVE